MISNGEQREAIAGVFYEWAATHPEPDEHTDLAGLVEALVSVRGKVCVPV
jgi:hypothetical protein